MDDVVSYDEGLQSDSYKKKYGGKDGKDEVDNSATVMSGMGYVFVSLMRDAKPNPNQTKTQTNSFTMYTWVNILTVP